MNEGTKPMIEDTAPATFEPDIAALVQTHLYADINAHNLAIASGERPSRMDQSVVAIQAVIDAYEAQRAEAGWVSVQRERIAELRRAIATLADWLLVNEPTDIDNQLRSYIRSLDAMAGDERRAG